MVTPFLKQAWVVSAVLSNMVGQGLLIGYTTSLLPALNDPNSTVKADLQTASFVASSIGPSGIPGFLISSLLMDIYGRKISHALVILPGLFGWVLIYFATNVSMIMVGRILGGITAGATVSLGAIVIGEYTDPKYRGMFLNLKTAAVCTGGMTCHIIGHFVQWRTLALFSMVPYVTSILIICTWPESPAWLASKQQFEKSEKSFNWLRGTDAQAHRELEELIQAQKDLGIKHKTDQSLSEKLKVFLKKFTQIDFLKPLAIISVGTLLLEFCGRHLFPAFALQIIGEVTGNASQSFVYTLCLDVIITASAIFSSILVKVMRRRTLLFSTGFAALAVLMSVCLYLYLAANKIISNERTWIPIGLFVVYFILANLGCTPIPLALLGELYPLAHRGAGSAVSGVVISLAVTMGLQLTPILLANVKVYGTFTVYGIAMGVTLLILYYTLPETKDRTLQEIEDYFNNGKFKDNNTSDDVEEKIKMIAKKERGLH